MVKILVKKFDKNIKLPSYKTSGSSGMDLIAYIKNKITINPGKIALVPTGIAVAIPKNYEIQIRPRSGLAANKSISVLNTTRLKNLIKISIFLYTKLLDRQVWTLWHL